MVSSVRQPMWCKTNMDSAHSGLHFGAAIRMDRLFSCLVEWLSF
jgi:hypothetical protein